MLVRMKSISDVNVKEETSSAAFDALEDWRDFTQSQITQALYKKANRFEINIASPIIVLPISSAAQAPVWVVRLGDMSVKS